MGFSDDFTGLGFTLPKPGLAKPRKAAEPLAPKVPPAPIVAIPFWGTNSALWDYCAIGPFPENPGIVSKIEINRSVKWDKKDGPGVNLCYTTYQGDSPAELSIELVIWQASQLDLAQKMIAFLFAKSLVKTKPRSPITIVHPVVAMHGLSLFVVDSVKGPTLPSRDGMSHITIELTQWGNPPKAPVTVTPDGHAVLDLGKGADKLLLTPSATYPSDPKGLPVKK